MEPTRIYYRTGGPIIEVMRMNDRANTVDVNLLRKGEDGFPVVEAVGLTPMQRCGLVTIMGGEYVVIAVDGELTVHATGLHTEDEVIDQVYALSEKHGLERGIKQYKKETRALDPYSEAGAW